MTYDAVVVGTRPAGLSAALTLGRARRSTLLIDGAAEGTVAAMVLDQELLYTQP